MVQIGHSYLMKGGFTYSDFLHLTCDKKKTVKWESTLKITFPKCYININIVSIIIVLMD